MSQRDFGRDADSPFYVEEVPRIDVTGRIDALMPQRRPAQRKPSFFGKGGTGRHITGLLGDYLAQLGGMQPIYGPAMQHQRDMEEREEWNRDYSVLGDFEPRGNWGYGDRGRWPWTP